MRARLRNPPTVKANDPATARVDDSDAIRINDPAPVTATSDEPPAQDTRAAQYLQLSQYAQSLQPQSYSEETFVTYMNEQDSQKSDRNKVLVTSGPSRKQKKQRKIDIGSNSLRPFENLHIEQLKQERPTTKIRK